MRLLVAILNHARSADALALRATLRGAGDAEAVALDSGSALTAAQRAQFDYVLPNVFYGGLVSAATAAGLAGNFTHVWLWTSDVSAPDAAAVVRRGAAILARDETGVYAPSADYSPHPQMRPRDDGRLRAVTFVDGFCFAARTDLLERLCEDAAGNKFGYGLDIHLGLLAQRAGRRVWVDHDVAVTHPRSTGYSARAAKLAWKRWRRQLSVTQRLFHRLAYQRRLKSDLGMRALLAVRW